MTNIKAWIEAGLRQTKEINDSEDIHICFGICSDQLTVVEWEKLKTVPIQLQKEQLEVKLFKIDGTQL